jgi:hypothetical protein
VSAPRFEELVIALGREFRRRRMNGHVAALRRFYRARQRRQAFQELASERGWDEDVVIEWLSIFRIAPFDRIYIQQPKEAACPHCARDHAQGADVDFRAIFPGGRLQECRACKAAWLSSDGTRDDTYVRGPGVIEEPRGGRRG